MNHQASKKLFNNYLPALVWGLWLFLIFLEKLQFDAIGVFLGLRSLLVLYFLLVRHEAIVGGTNFQKVIAWASAMLPLTMTWHSDNNLGAVISLAGNLLSGLAIIDLGRSFGVSPAVRPFVVRGVYNYIPHPMYLGHIIAEVGILVTNPSLSNFGIAVTTWAFYTIRMKWEADLHKKSGSESAFITNSSSFRGSSGVGQSLSETC